MKYSRRRFLAGAISSAVLAAARAQAPARRRLGLLGIEGSDLWGGDLPRIFEELARLGYPRGVRLEVLERYARTPEELDEFARQLAAIPVDVVLTEGTPSTLAAQRATKVIPIVTTVGDPLAAGFAKSLQNPGGNITGLSQSRAGLARKEIELLRLLRPRIAEMAILWEEPLPGIEIMIKPMAEAASEAGIRVRKLSHGEKGLAKRLEELKAWRIDTAFCMPITPKEARLAIRQRIAIVAAGVGPVETGALMGAENDGSEDYARVAAIIDKIFRGQKPADMPWEVASRFITAVNAKTAAALGIRLTPEVLLRVDRVIE
jgi:putative ABC transport system substrate-binding protein